MCIKIKSILLLVEEYVVCWACQNLEGKVGKVHQCAACLHYVHAFCSTPAPGCHEGYGQQVTCFVAWIKVNINFDIPLIRLIFKKNHDQPTI